MALEEQAVWGKKAVIKSEKAETWKRSKDISMHIVQP